MMRDEQYEGVIIAVRSDAVWAQLNRPEALNALSPPVVAGLGRAIELAEELPAVRALVISAVGRVFCAGADLKFLQSSPEHRAAFLRSVGELFSRLEACARPVVAAVNGLALAGGLELVLSCDLVYASESARFGDAHSNYGLIPGGGGSVRLPRRIGLNHAKYLMFTGETVPASSPVLSGLVNCIVPDGELDAAVEQLVQKLAAKSPLGLQRMKQLLNDAMEQSVATGLRLELAASDAHAMSADMQEGLAAFAEKRSPRFVGQ
jgi:enoyl-CoA hydratase